MKLQVYDVEPLPMLEADIVEMRGLGEAEALVKLYALCVISCYAGN